MVWRGTQQPQNGVLTLQMMSLWARVQMSHHELQILYPLMEFLHHYRLNQRRARGEGKQQPGLPRIFAPLLLRPERCSVMVASQVGPRRESDFSVNSCFRCRRNICCPACSHLYVPVCFVLRSGWS